MRFPAAALLSVVVVVAIAAGTVVDVLLPPPAPAASGGVKARPATAGIWYCAVGDTAGGREMVVTAAVPTRSLTGASVRMDGFAAGGETRGAEVEVLPGGLHDHPVAGGSKEVGIAARWERGPSAVHRTWTTGGGTSPTAIVEGPCEPEPSRTWYLPGVSTAGGATARISIANPFATDAAVAITLLTPEGVEEPELLRNVGVQARTVRTIDLNRHAPELVDLAAVVTVRAGRVVAEAWQSLDAAIGGVDGASLVKLAQAPAERWLVPWFHTAGADAWLTVANPGEGPASLTLTVHTSSGGVAAAGAEEVTVPPGTVSRVDLGGVLPEGVESGAVGVAVTNDVPVVAAATTLVRSSRADRGGIAVQLGVAEADRFWTIVTGPTAGREEVLHLLNPSAEEATVDVAIVGATDKLKPAELQGIRVPPGAAVDAAIAPVVGDLGRHAIFVSADRPVVAGVHGSSRGGALRLVAHPGVPGGVFLSRPLVFTPRRSVGLVQRLGTAGGPAISPRPTPAEVDPGLTAPSP